MTKQEVYDALVQKFDKVDPINEWELRNSSGLLGINIYLIDVFSEGVGFKNFTLFVDDDGGTAESASFGPGDPLKETPVAGVPIAVRVRDELEARKAAGQIVDGFIKTDRSGSTVCEVVVYTESGSDLTAHDYVVWEIDENNLGFKKLV